MGRIGDETSLLPQQLIYAFQQTVYGVYKRRDLIREAIIGDRLQPVR